MMVKITLIEIMTNSFDPGILNVVASPRIKHYVDYVELNCSFAVKVNCKHLMELLGSPPRLPRAC